MKKFGAAAAAAAALALLVPFAAHAGSPRDRATGGGQVLVGDRGAGDTIAFTAQNRDGASSDAATGQVQYVDRTGGTGQGQTTYHGTVVCLRVEGKTAKLAGRWSDGGPFQVLVVDNGEGAAAENDIVTVQDVADPTCDEDDDDDDGQTALARGNAQVYDAG